jgi:hypothetical protein
MDGQTDKVLLQIPSENHKVRTITSKFHQNPTIPLEDNMLKTFSQSDTMQAHKKLNVQGICRTSNLSEGLMDQVSQASFIKIPPFLLEISCGKHSANQIAAA